MASPVRLVVPAWLPEPLGRAAWAAVVDEFEACEQAMSRFRPSSAVTRLNRRTTRDGGPGRVAWRLRRAIVATERARRATGGAFDPRLVDDLDRIGYRGSPLRVDGSDGDGRGAIARERPVIRQLTRDGRVELTAPVDLGGIGKGLALRWSRDRVRAALPPESGFLLDAGGDLVAAGPGPAPGPWRVEIEDPRAGDAGLAVIELEDGAVATSSIRINRWAAADGRPAHHLLDPRTGAPGGDGLLAVTVAGTDPAWAEVRTKQLFLAGPRAIGPLARSLDLAAWWVDADGRLSMTPAARQRTSWLASEAA